MRVVARPGRACVVALAPQEHLRDPVAAAHQVRAEVLACAREIADLLLGFGRDAHERQAARGQQPRESLRVARVGLDPVAGTAVGPLRVADRDVEAVRCGDTCEAVARRACLVDGLHRLLERQKPRNELGWASPQLPSLELPGVAVDDGRVRSTRACSMRRVTRGGA